jgi:hypothetical protein
MLLVFKTKKIQQSLKRAKVIKKDEVSVYKVSLAICKIITRHYKMIQITVSLTIITDLGGIR